MMGPRRRSSSIAREMASSTSSSATQGSHWRPLPTGPPSPARNGGSIWARAPPRADRTTPSRRWTTRIPASSASAVEASQALQTSAAKPPHLVQERGLAGARGADERRELARVDREADVADRVDDRRAGPVGLGHVVDLADGHWVLQGSVRWGSEAGAGPDRDRGIGKQAAEHRHFEPPPGSPTPRRPLSSAPRRPWFDPIAAPRGCQTVPSGVPPHAV